MRNGVNRTFSRPTTGELIAEFTLNPNKNYQSKNG